MPRVCEPMLAPKAKRDAQPMWQTSSPVADRVGVGPEDHCRLQRDEVRDTGEPTPKHTANVGPLQARASSANRLKSVPSFGKAGTWPNSCHPRPSEHSLKISRMAILVGMSNLNTLLERNRSFARTEAKDKVPAIPFIPNRQLVVLTCIDPRVDPAQVLGLELGDAIVVRNVGGRVTAAVLQDLGWISHLHREKTPDADWFEIVVVHHTDCGSALFGDETLRAEFARLGHYDSAELAELAVVDPAKTVAVDVETLRAAPLVDSGTNVSGFVYDVATGLLTEVVRPDRVA